MLASCASPYSGSGYGDECTTISLSSSCTQYCTSGYTDNNSGNGQVLSCDSGGSLSGSELTCTPDDCTENVPIGTGMGSECDSLVTDSSCTQGCTTGYSNANGGGSYTCSAGTFSGTLLECSPDSCSANVPTNETIAMYNNECDDLVTDGDCIQTCGSGYTNVNGGGNHTCPSGTFEGETIDCQNIDECEDAPCSAGGDVDAICTPTTPPEEGYSCECGLRYVFNLTGTESCEYLATEPPAGSSANEVAEPLMFSGAETVSASSAVAVLLAFYGLAF